MLSRARPRGDHAAHLVGAIWLVCSLGPGCDSEPAGARDATAADMAPADRGGEAVGQDAATPGPGCAAAKLLTLTAGRVKVSGSTDGAANEFGEGINCGTSSTHSGPQVYYRIDLLASRDYVVTLTPAFSRASLYIFGTSCTASAINSGCGSGGKTGAVSLGTAAGDEVKILFAPVKTGSYTLAVDSADASANGPFTLTVE